MLIVITVQMIQNHYLLCNVVDVGYSSNNSKRERGGREGERGRERERERVLFAVRTTQSHSSTQMKFIFNSLIHCPTVLSSLNKEESPAISSKQAAERVIDNVPCP